MKNNDIKISVIIPVYNTKNFLERCIESIMYQTYTNIELILVDDGSTDGSGELCDRYTFDERVIVIHKPNGGVSSARNVGIDKATGDYICFVDSDDFIDKDYLCSIVIYLEKQNIDFLINNYLIDDVSLGVVNKFSKNVKRKLKNRDAILSMIEQKVFDWSAVATFYKADIMKNCKGDETIAFVEDLKFKYDFFCLAKEGLYVPVAKYHYVIRSDSAVHSYPLHKKKDCLNVFRYVMEKEQNHIGEFLFNEQYLPTLIRYYKNLVLRDDDANFEKELKGEILRIFKEGYFSFRIKAKLKAKMLRCLLPRTLLKGIYSIIGTTIKD